MESTRPIDLGKNENERHNLKYGFVYIWYDRKHKRYYIGCHWGKEDDGYICSSRWMRQSFKRRPKDFKRRIISKVYSNRKALLEEEFRWLSMIKSEELKTRYYNLYTHHFNHWSTNNDNKFMIEKMKESQQKTYAAMTVEERSQRFGHNKGRIQTDEEKEKRAAKNNGNIPWNAHKKGVKTSNKGQKPWNRDKTDCYSEEVRYAMGSSTRGKKLGDRLTDVGRKSIKDKNSSNMKRLWQNPSYRKMMLNKRKKVS